MGFDEVEHGKMLDVFAEADAARVRTHRQAEAGRQQNHRQQIL